MATATGIVIGDRGRQQFQGVFERVWVVRFTVNVGQLASNAVDATDIAVPGLDPQRDVVLGWTHDHEGAHGHEYIESFHAWDDEIHLVVHNVSGGNFDPPSVDYTVVIGRLTAGI